MGRRGWITAVAVVAVASAGAACADDAGDAGAPGSTSAPVEWPTPGHDLDNSRSVPDSPIRGDSVDRLVEAWAADVDGSLSTVPLVVDETVYVQDGTGTVRALDLEGRELWRSEPYGFNIGPFGVAVDDGRVFGMHGSTGVVALDADTGQELWATTITATPTEGVDIQPLAVDGLVLASTVPISVGGIYTGGDRGVIHALDAATGVVRWRFDTIDGPDLWGNPAVNSGGGAWYPPAVDTDRGLVIWGVANPAPFPGTAEYPNGTSRPGQNLYTHSAVALDLRTGERRWHHQAIPHDLFDRDMVHTMIARPPGEDEVVVHTGKGGIVIGLDPDTGRALWTTEIGRHEHDDLTSLPGPTTVTPGTYGGVLTPPATADGIAYVATVNAPSELRPDEVAYTGAALGGSDGEVVAIDTTDGAIRWAIDVPGDPLGGVTVVGDLVVVPLFDGTILALDRHDGADRWRGEAPGGINGSPAVAGDLMIVPVGNADAPRLVAYRLDG